MAGGYVLDFSDRTFGEFMFESVGVDIHDPKFCAEGTSKAKKLRSFWKIEDDGMVGRAVLALVRHAQQGSSARDAEWLALAERGRAIATRLVAGGPALDPLKEQAERFDAHELRMQIRRMEGSIESDPSLAIGTAKELIETTCRTILAERGKPVSGTPDVATLTKEALRELRLVPEGVPAGTRGTDVLKRLLSNLGTIGNNLAELRGLYGTGHGKDGRVLGLRARHAKLAVGAAATLATFLFETHLEQAQRFDDAEAGLGL